MSLTVSSKYQVVIPRAVRKQLSIKPGQKMRVTALPDGRAILEKDEQIDIEVYAGILRDEWGKNSVAKLRKIRDENWD